MWRCSLIINYFPIFSLYFGIIIALSQQDDSVLNLTGSLFCLINCHKLGISFSINLSPFQICQQALVIFFIYIVISCSEKVKKHSSTKEGDEPQLILEGEGISFVWGRSF